MAIVSDEQVIKVLRQYNPPDCHRFGKGYLRKHETVTPILRVPAIAFLYLLGRAEAEGKNRKL